ncbi:MAG: pirin family protein [Raineya sp.]|nr:pirin family protein [Raineya sp.]
MKKVVHLAKDRGYANFGWLQARYSFSFGNYYNPEKVHFGALRVLNDDIILGGTGFATHPHDNMEIVTIPLEGGLAHEDSTGQSGIIRKNDVQIMSAGTGIYHSEKNAFADRITKHLQIWVFPKVRNIPPRYAQKSYPPESYQNRLQVVVAPDRHDEALWINQDAYFWLGNFEKDQKVTYQIQKQGNGVYAFLIEGQAEIAGETLHARDAVGVWETDNLKIKFSENSHLLLIEVPMNLNSYR